MTPELVTLHVWRIPRAAVPRALARMATHPARLRRMPGVRFAKLLGTGTGTGFGPGDADLTRWAALVVWDSPAAAAGFDASPVGRSWARLARAGVRVELRPLTSRGEWAGRRPFGEPPGGRVAGPVTSARLASRSSSGGASMP
ncbi:monooxygenase, partial [Micromonospora sp. NPDC004540]